MQDGPASLTNEELLAIILKTGTLNISVKELAIEVMTHLNSINDLKDITLSKLTNIKGIGNVKAIELLATIELGKRIYLKAPTIRKYQIKNPLDIINYYQKIYEHKYQELFYVIYLDSKNNIISHKLLFVGTLNRSIVHPREIFKEAYLLCANSLVCVHNHPSGDSTPSKEDIELTKKITEISMIHDVKLLDHLIIGDNNYYSFYEKKKVIL